MHNFAETYYKNLFCFINAITVTNKQGMKLTFSEGVERVGSLIQPLIGGTNKIIFIGNGGSAAIASHMAVDFWKNAGIKATSFNDGPQITCLGNDFGYKHVFEKPIEMFAASGDLLIAISSSGRSENVLLGVCAARLRGCHIVTLSGFDKENPLSSQGEYNFYVPSQRYGPVEIIHHSICHCFVDTIMESKGDG